MNIAEFLTYEALYKIRIVQLSLLEDNLEKIDGQIKQREEQYKDLDTSRWVISEVATQTQKELKEYIEELLTASITPIYENNNYKVICNFDIKRNVMGCEPLIKEGTAEPFKPRDESCGGMKELLSFAFRLCMKSLEDVPTRNVFILDEPFRSLGVMSEKAIKIIQEASKVLGIQMLIFTHDERIFSFADRAWEVTRTDKQSIVTRIK